MKVIGIYYDVFFQKKPLFLPQKLWEVICHRANPRSVAYMKDVFETVYHEGEITSFENLSISADKLVILYPDAIGLGQGSIESQLKRKKRDIFVLTGRKRHFELTGHMRLKLSIKRFLEVSFLIELLSAPFLLALALFFALKDKILRQP